MIRSRSWTLLCLFAAMVASNGAIAQQVGVRLTRVPDRVVLPARAGENLIVEAEVLGSPDAVWLAVAAADVARVPLELAGKGRYQINLRDKRVLPLLPGDRDEGTLRVFASKANKTGKSTGISWVRGQPAKGVVCHIVTVAGKVIVCEPGRDPWLDPAQVERLEVRGMNRTQARVVAVADGTTMPFAMGKQRRPHVLLMNKGVRKSIHGSSEFGVHVQHGGRSWWFGFRVVPGSIDEWQEPVHIAQRKRVKLPGCNEWLTLQIGDVTKGTVWVNVVNAKNRTVVQPRLMGENDFAEIKLANKTQVLVLDRLVNRLVGDDSAMFRIVDKDKFKPDEVALLLRRIGTAKVKYVREGQDHNADIAQQFLRVRLLNNRKAKWTPEQFIEAASKSSRTGDPYQIKLADGKVVPAKKWFTEQLLEIRREQQAAR